MEPSMESVVRYCRNHKRGCKTILEPSYKKRACESCLEKDRLKDKRCRERVKNSGFDAETEQFCNTCNKVKGKDCFIGLDGNITKTCNNCREQGNIRDKKRDKEHRNELARVASKNPNQVQRKKEWVKNNRDKVVNTWMTHRQRQIQNDVEAYRKRQAEIAKQWREANPEKVKVINDKKKQSVKVHKSNYIRTAQYKGLEYCLTDEEFCQLVNMNCYYCGMEEEDKLMGIDRKDPNKGYIIANCVPCCKMCNFMKGSLCDNTYIGRAYHILSHHKLVEGQYIYNTLFPDCHSDKGYITYRKEAISRNKEFSLSEQEFYTTICDPCSICGKLDSETHQNGIDRIDNDIGYQTGNIQSCCGECNFMKREYPLIEFLGKLADICITHPNFELDTENIISVNHIQRNPNKMTKNEIQLLTKEKKEKQTEELLLRYNDENIANRVKEQCEK